MSEAYYAYDGDSYEECSTIDEAIKACENYIQYCRECCDPEWPLSVEDIHIRAGPSGVDHFDMDDLEVTHTVKECNVEYADGELDEDGRDGSGREFTSVDYYCDYELVAVTAPN